MKVTMKPCYRSGGPQLFIITKVNQIQINFWCLEAGLVDMPVGLNICHNISKQQWIYNEAVSFFGLVFIMFTYFGFLFQTQEFRSGQNNVNCLGAEEDQLLWLRKCNGSPYQKWIISKLNNIE